MTPWSWQGPRIFKELGKSHEDLLLKVFCSDVCSNSKYWRMNEKTASESMEQRISAVWGPLLFGAGGFEGLTHPSLHYLPLACASTPSSATSLAFLFLWTPPSQWPTSSRPTKEKILRHRLSLGLWFFLPTGSWGSAWDFEGVVCR